MTSIIEQVGPEPCGLIILTEADHIEAEKMIRSSHRGVREGVTSVIRKFEKLFGLSG